MKRIILFILLICTFTISGYGQSKSEMKQEIADLKLRLKTCHATIDELSKKNDSLIAQINEIKRFVAGFPRQITIVHQENASDASQNHIPTSNATAEAQCAAITKAGTRCSRTVQSGSRYCWQHTEKLKNLSSPSYNSGHVWHTGPRGGQYYINSKGNKVYRKRK